jgi:hypothetical protein
MGEAVNGGRSEPQDERGAGGSAPHGGDEGRMDEESSPDAQPDEIEFAVDPSQVLRVLLSVTGLLVALSTATQAIVYYLPDFPLRDPTARLFYVDAEQSLPTLYSTMLLFVGALMSGFIARGHRRSGRPYVGHWGALSLVFSLLALDEFAALHEQTGEPVQEMLGIEGGPLWFAWVVPGALAVALFGIAFVRFLGHLPSATRHRLTAAGILFVGGAIGVELVGGSYVAVHGKLDFTYVLIATVEESLEMLGSAVLIYALLAYVRVRLPDVVWRLRDTASD